MSVRFRRRRLSSSLLAFALASLTQTVSAQVTSPQPAATATMAPARVPETTRTPGISSASGVEPLSPRGVEPTTPTSNALSPLTGSLGLGDVLREADVRNLDIIAANSTTVSAQARVQQAAMPPLQFVGQPSIAQDVPGGVRQLQVLSAGIQQQIAPGLGAAKRLAGLDVTVARATAQAMKREVQQHIVDAYYALGSSQAGASAADQNLRSANELVAAARLRQRAGAIGGFEVLRATVEARRAQSEALQADAAVRQAAITLGAVVGRAVDPAASLSLDPEAASTDLGKVASITRALSSDPISSQLRATLARSRAQVDAARAQRLPTVSIAGGYTLQRAPSVSNLGSRGPTGSIGVRLPIVDYGTIRGAEREAQANAATARAQISGRELQLNASIEGASAAMESSRARLDFAATSLRQAEEGLRIAQIGFRAGALGTLDVISARTAATTARADLDQTRSEYAAAVAKLRILLGDPITP